MVVSPLVVGIVPLPLVVMLGLLVRRMRRVLLLLLVKVARLLLPVVPGELHQLLPVVPPLVAGQRLRVLLVGRLV